jgi:hypothetical protein
MKESNIVKIYRKGIETVVVLGVRWVLPSVYIEKSVTHSFFSEVFFKKRRVYFVI